MITTSPYDIYLGDKNAITGYRLKAFNRDSAPLVAPKFSTGSEGQTDLDLLKSVSIDDLSGGMFQRDWIESTKAARAIGLFNPMDRNFYPTPTPTPKTASFSTGYIIAKVDAQLSTFIATGRFVTGSGAGTGWVNRLFSVSEVDGTVTEIVLPATFTSSSPGFITDLALHDSYLYISSNDKRNNYRMNLATNAFQDIGGQGVIMRELRGVLYHINSVSKIYSMTNEFAAGAATYTKIDVLGFSDKSAAVPTDAVELNSALWICKPDGLFRFDGVRSVKVLDLVTTKLTLYNGAIYFVAGNWLYKFDGVNVTKLQFFGLQEETDRLNFAATSDYLYFQTKLDVSASYPAYDTPKIGTASALTRIYQWDGQAFTMLSERTIDPSFSLPTVGLVQAGNMLLDLLHVPEDPTSSTRYTSTYRVYDTRALFESSAISSDSRLEVTSSEFDAGFPNIFKTVNVLEVSHLDMLADDSIDVQYQIFDGKTWSAWLSLGSITSTTSNYIEISDSAMLFRRIKFNIKANLSAGSTLKLRSLSMRYTVQPRHRWRWNFTVEIFNSLSDRMGQPLSTSANMLNNLVTRSLRSKTPTYLFSPDYAVTSSVVNSSGKTFVLSGDLPLFTDPYDEIQLIALKNANDVWEIMRVKTATYDAGTDQTTIEVKERGYMGIVPISIPAGSEFHLCYRVYVTRLMRDNTLLSEDTFDEQPDTGESQIEREFVLEVIEV